VTVNARVGGECEEAFRAGEESAPVCAEGGQEGACRMGLRGREAE
jgi:hypothetical protein